MSESFYVTTPIYYVNGPPHIGHTYTTVVADTLTRYRRLCGENTFLLTGSDEHGEKLLEVAQAAGEEPGPFAERFSSEFRKVWDELGLRYDRFLRTTEPAHEAVVQQILQRVYDEGHIEFREYEGDYCVGCERFLTERDLVDGLCADHERAPEKRGEANYFFKMSQHFAWLEQYIRDNPDFIRPERYRNEALAMLREEVGLGDLCISRPKSRLPWGVTLPFDDKYVCYVWFDALISYISGIGYPDDEGFEALWSNSQHLIGKDILKPHAVFWPIMLRAIGLPPVKQLTVHGYWNVDDRKVSKSLGNMISPLIMRDKYGFDAFRYFLLRDMVFGLDSSFTEEALIGRINSDLANNLGNLVSRSLTMTKRNAGGEVPAAGAGEAEEREVEAALAEAVGAVDGHVRKLELHRALEAIMRAVDAVNRYLEHRQPWKAAKDPERAEELATTLYTCCESLRILALLISPFLPDTANEIARRIGVPELLESAQLPGDAAWGGLQPGTPTQTGDPLFPRIEAKD
jgi:methionyl-tRNA synthetase